MLQRWRIPVIICVIFMVCWDCAQKEPKDSEILPLQEGLILQIGKSSSDALMKDLKSHLLEAWEENDPVAALEFCTLEALVLTQSVQNTLPEGVRLKRTSSRFRNPKNTPDSIDTIALDHFTNVMNAQEELPKHLIRYVETDKEYRYYQPLKMGTLCLNCHGHLDQMEPGIIASLQENYPQDMATGYREGDANQIR